MYHFFSEHFFLYNASKTTMCLPESVGRGVKSDEVLDGKDDDAGGVETEQLDVPALTASQRPTLD